MDPQTNPIPQSVIDFAVVASVAGLKTYLYGEASSYVSYYEDEQRSYAFEEHVEELLWKSNILGWYWANSDISLANYGTITMGAPSLPLLGNYWHFDAFSAAPLVGTQQIQGRELNITGSWTARMLPEHSIGRLVLYASRYGRNEYRENAIRSFGMALVSDWSLAWANNELTRGIPDDAISRVVHEESWYRKVVADLKKFAALSTDWDGYGAEAPNQKALTLALSVLEGLRSIGMEPESVLASAAGGVSICFAVPGKYAEVECYNTGKAIAIAKYTSNNKRTIWEVNSIFDALMDIKHFLEGRTVK